MGVGLKANIDINPTDWMKTRNHDIANELRLPHSTQQSVNEIMKTINESINNFDQNDKELKKEEIKDIFIEGDYLGGDKTDLKSDIKIININNNWEISREPNDVEIIKIDPTQPSRKERKRKKEKITLEKVMMSR